MQERVMEERETVHTVGSSQFTISKYTSLKAIGKGSYGVVVSALDPSTGNRVAIKKITPMAKHTIDAKHILREVRIMRYMGKHENIVTLEDLHVRERADELYIVMELMDTDLHRVLQSKQCLTEAHNRHFLFQILCGLKHLHDNRIIHRDLKPGNLLVTRDCRLRITDFGLAREMATGPDPDDEISEPMTEHVVTRWYRPPELMLCPDGLYAYAVDMWSVGCIFAEMIGRKPIFPGKNFVHQLSLIFDVIGTPTFSQVAHIKNAQAKKFLDGQIGKDVQSYNQLYPQASAESLQLLQNLLVFAPEERYNVDKALGSRFFDEADMAASPSMYFPESDERFQFEFERNGSSKFQLKALIVQEVLSFKKELGCDHVHGKELGRGQGKEQEQEQEEHNFDACIDLGPSKYSNELKREMETERIREIDNKISLSGNGSSVVSKCEPSTSTSSDLRHGVSVSNAPVASKNSTVRQRAVITTAKPRRPSSASTNTVASKLEREKPTVRAKRPASASVASTAAKSVHAEAEKALASARAWLTAAASAASESGLEAEEILTNKELKLKESSRTQARTLDRDVAISKKAMEVLRSPLRQDRFKGSPKRYGTMQQQRSKTTDLPPPFPKSGVPEDRAKMLPAGITVTTIRRPLTVAKSPKFSVMSRQKGSEKDLPASTNARRF